MTKAERLFLTKGNWHVECKSPHYAKEKATDQLVNIYNPLTESVQQWMAGFEPFPCECGSHRIHCVPALEAGRS